MKKAICFGKEIIPSQKITEYSFDFIIITSSTGYYSMTKQFLSRQKIALV